MSAQETSGNRAVDEPRWGEETDSHGCVRFSCDGDEFAYFTSLDPSAIKTMRRLVAAANRVDDLESQLARATEALELDAMEGAAATTELRHVISTIESIISLQLGDRGVLP